MPQLCNGVTEAKPVSQRYAEPECGGAIDRHCTPPPPSLHLPGHPQPQFAVRNDKKQKEIPEKHRKLKKQCFHQMSIPVTSSSVVQGHAGRRPRLS